MLNVDRAGAKRIVSRVEGNALRKLGPALRAKRDLGEGSDMKIERAALALVVALTCFGGAPSAEAGGDAARGAAIAKRWCANCHVVSADQKSGKVDVPTFADVARRQPDDRALANFLVDPHPPMPNLNLSRQEIDDVVSYIRSLDPKAPRAPNPKTEPDLPTKG
jgi:mono/diheme cytochrome c family protein